MRRPPRAALRVVFLDYLAFYRTNWSEGKLCICNEAAVRAPARRFLDAAGWRPSEGFGRFDVSSIAEACLRMKRQPGGLVFRRLIRAFEFLELLCVNLFLSPWRKEIRSLKTFTGNFVYCMQSVLPECIVEELLEKIGYVATTATEFSLVRKLKEEEAEQTAFEIFLARIECEDLLEITKEVRDCDLGDVLQKRAQKHWHLGEVGKKYPASHGKECILNRGGNKRPRYLSSPQRNLRNDQPAFGKTENTEFGGDLSLTDTTVDLQQAPPEFSSEQSSNQIQEDASAPSCAKSSDSEEFLTKYSDIVIGQKPLHLTNLPLKASEDKSWVTGRMGTTLGPPPNTSCLQTVLSPNASGPQALAILNDTALEGREACRDYGAQESSQEAIESDIRDAMNCLSVCESYPMDQPKELKGGSVVQRGNKLHIVMSLSREEGPDASNQLKFKEDSEGELIYPVEETAQAESMMYRTEPQEFSPSRVKFADIPRGDKEDFSIDLYSSDQFPNTTKNAYPTNSSKFDGLLVGASSPHRASECYRYTGELSGSTYAILPSISEFQFPSGISNLQGKGDLEGQPLQEVCIPTCIVKMNETNPEGYVVISKD